MHISALFSKSLTQKWCSYYQLGVAQLVHFPMWGWEVMGSIPNIFKILIYKKNWWSYLFIYFYIPSIIASISSFFLLSVWLCFYYLLNHRSGFRDILFTHRSSGMKNIRYGSFPYWIFFTSYGNLRLEQTGFLKPCAYDRISEAYNWICSNYAVLFAFLVCAILV